MPGTGVAGRCRGGGGGTDTGADEDETQDADEFYGSRGTGASTSTVMAACRRGWSLRTPRTGRATNQRVSETNAFSNTSYGLYTQHNLYSVVRACPLGGVCWQRISRCTLYSHTSKHMHECTFTEFGHCSKPHSYQISYLLYYNDTDELVDGAQSVMVAVWNTVHCLIFVKHT